MKTLSILRKAVNIIVYQNVCPANIDSNLSFKTEKSCNWKACERCTDFTKETERKCWMLYLAGKRKVANVNVEYKNLLDELRGILEKKEFIAKRG